MWDIITGYSALLNQSADYDLDGGIVNCALQERSGFWHDGCSTIGCARVNSNAQPPIVEVEVEFVEMKIRQLNCNI